MTELAGHRQDDRGEDRRAARRPARSRRAEQAQGQVPARPGRGHAHPRARAEEGAQAVRRAGRRLARRRSRDAAEGEQIRGLQGFGAKAEESVLPGARRRRRRAARSRACCCRRRWRSPRRWPPRCASTRRAERVEIAGSARRMAETVQGPRPRRHRDRPGGAGGGVLRAAADRRGAVAPATAGRARRDPQRHRRSTCASSPPESFGNLLQHLTGSKQHNEALRTEAVKRGLHVSEYGVLDDADGITRTCATEEEVYELLGMELDPAGAAREPRRAEGRARGRAAAS